VEVVVAQFNALSQCLRHKKLVQNNSISDSIFRIQILRKVNPETSFNTCQNLRYNIIESHRRELHGQLSFSGCEPYRVSGFLDFIHRPEFIEVSCF
jgi:hypothetical protein